MAGYEKFLIADFKKGLYEDKEAWLIPSDAFSEADNVYIYKGVINKRKGHVPFDRFVHEHERYLWTGDGASVDFSGTLSGTLPDTEMRSGDVVFSHTTDLGVDELTDVVDDGVLLGTLTTASGIIDYTSGAWSVALDSDHPTLSGTTASGVFSDYPGYPIVGIWNHFTTGGAVDLVMMDTRRLNLYNEDDQLLYDYSGGVDIWDGTEERYMATVTYKDDFYMVNYKDRLKVWDTDTQLITDVDVILVAANELNTCLMLFESKERLILLHTNEATDGLCPQRARWSAVNDGTDWTGDEYVDAPTSEWIQSAEFIGDDLVVFFDRSIWLLEYSGSSLLPFTWRKIVDGEGSYAPFSTSVLNNEIITRGATHMVICNGINNAQPVDDDILDFTIKSNQNKVDWTYNGHLDELKQDWFTYVDSGSEFCNKILVYNYFDSSWTTYSLPLSSIGFYEVSEDLIWDEIEGDVDDCEVIFDERAILAGYPTTLGGTRTGYINTMNVGGTDDGEAISFSLKTKRFNPWAGEGKSVRLGYVEFYVTVDNGITVDVNLYKDTEETSYQTTSITFDSDDGNDKTWKRVYSGAVGYSHQIQLSHTASNQTFEIHAIRMAMKPLGRGGI